MEDIIDLGEANDITQLTKEELISIVEQKERATKSYEAENSVLKSKLTTYEKEYKKANDYHNQLIDNIIERNTQKENAIHQIIAGTLNLMLLDRKNIKPEIKEEEVQKDED